MTPHPILISVPTVQIRDVPFQILLEANTSERESIAARLQIPAVFSLSVEAEISCSGDDGFMAKALLKAAVRRICVITLKEFEETLETTFSVKFAPQGADSPNDEDDPVEEIQDGGLALGDVAIEHLSLELSSYPRHPEAPPPGEADWLETQTEDAPSPLAVALRELRSS